jgi:hypothetical protein
VTLGREQPAQAWLEQVWRVLAQAQAQQRELAVEPRPASASWVAASCRAFAGSPAASADSRVAFEDSPAASAGIQEVACSPEASADSPAASDSPAGSPWACLASAGDSREAACSPEASAGSLVASAAWHRGAAAEADWRDFRAAGDS